jgi:pimeloyl-ACP methyl ester carboxylesterase
MPALTAADGTKLAYRVLGSGEPLVCVPGGPMRDADYLGDLGGLSAHRQLVVLDLRGTGRSAVPRDPASYRCDRLAADVEALRAHLGLDQLDLLGHSAGASIAVQYAASHPDRIRRLLLIAPSTRSVGLEATPAQRRAVMESRAAEPWYAAGAAAFERIQADGGTDTDWDAIAPFFYGRWDSAARAACAAGEQQHHEEAAAGYAADGAFDPPATRAVLAALRAPVLIVGGSVDVNTVPPLAAEFAAAFPAGRLVMQAGAGHYPWMDDPARLVATVTTFLAGTS